MSKRLAKKIFKKGGNKNVKNEKDPEVIPDPETKKKKSFIPPPTEDEV